MSRADCVFDGHLWHDAIALRSAVKRQMNLLRASRRSTGLALMGFLHDGPDGFIGAIADPIPVHLNGTGLFRPIR